MYFVLPSARCPELLTLRCRSGPQRETLIYQATCNNHEKPATGPFAPTVAFRYQISSMAMKMVYSRMSATELLYMLLNWYVSFILSTALKPCPLAAFPGLYASKLIISARFCPFAERTPPTTVMQWRGSVHIGRECTAGQ